MREILFRGKRVDNGEWVYGDYFSLFERPCIKFGESDKEIVGVKAETVGQYTGLTDKNGVKIYEGDVVAIYDKNNKLTDICFIEFHKYAYCCAQYICGKKYYDLLKAEQRDESGEIFEIYSYEVIGNIFENPELLGETK